MQSCHTQLGAKHGYVTCMQRWKNRVCRQVCALYNTEHRCNAAALSNKPSRGGEGHSKRDTHKMAAAAPWKQALEKALEANKDTPTVNWVQMATVRPDGRPACRTLWCRGFLGDSDKLAFLGDRRWAAGRQGSLDGSAGPDAAPAGLGIELGIPAQRRPATSPKGFFAERLLHSGSRCRLQRPTAPPTCTPSPPHLCPRPHAAQDAQGGAGCGQPRGRRRVVRAGQGRFSSLLLLILCLALARGRGMERWTSWIALHRRYQHNAQGCASVRANYLPPPVQVLCSHHGAVPARREAAVHHGR